ncbi:MAG: prenyltransferase [Candidatus Odinarchaeum yellowstonii]|uniref:Prenyltransferase n=1 Tax=Odinarchaeota yellowstonii (strain LCB_4) TaxID=1841599 RepID=A0AAF0I9T1_ODILC|nr:MAG: prenyltransferase [Candidatus Odinarchaeum yellowstonii]
MSKKTDKFRAWVALSRLPFHTVGVLPFILGGVLAWSLEAVFRWDVFAWGTLGVVFVMLATYYAGEYWDYMEDSLSASFKASRFSGGSKVLQRNLLPRRAALWASLISVMSAVSVGLILQLVYQTGVLTIPLGVIGLIGGFFYSTRPIRWVRTGLGELWIALCYGWLPVAVGYYLQTASIPPLIHLIALPIGFTIFNVILLNEFPDYQADLAAKKTNLAVRLGLERASYLYVFANVGSWGTVFLSIAGGVPIHALWFYLPVLIMSLMLVISVIRGLWRDRAMLERLCAVNLIANLSTTLVYILAFII